MIRRTIYLQITEQQTTSNSVASTADGTSDATLTEESDLRMTINSAENKLIVHYIYEHFKMFVIN
jgi:hypothetical protein